MMSSPNRHRRERGSGLIIVILIVAFMLAVGMLLLTVTGMSPQASDSLRLQSLAFDAAEAGFNAAWASLNDGFSAGLFTSFAGHYHSEYGGVPNTLDNPFLGPNAPNPMYFRALTDEQLVQDILDHPDPNVLFTAQTLETDPRCSYTVFLVNDEPPGTIVQNDNDAVLVCIGRGPRNTYKRLEIVIECPQ